MNVSNETAAGLSSACQRFSYDILSRPFKKSTSLRRQRIYVLLMIASVCNDIFGNAGWIGLKYRVSCCSCLLMLLRRLWLSLV